LQARIQTRLDAQVAAALRTGEGELGTSNRGLVDYYNGYAAAIGAEAHGGPEVFLLSQSRLADPDAIGAEVTRLAPPCPAPRPFSRDHVISRDLRSRASRPSWASRTTPRTPP
jgi:hypothetical protein